MRLALSRNQLARGGALLCIGTAVVWGLRLTALEGFVYEWQLGFKGDFSAAMYDPIWWDGTGIMYGPVFVAERWLVNAWPRIFNVYFFALANIPLVVLAFALSAAAARANRTAAFAALAAWLCFRWLYQAFAVAANPEILELLFLTCAWYAASRARPAATWIAAALAALTKVIPAIFAPLLLLRASRNAIAAAVVTVLVAYGAVGVGQRLSLKQLVLDVVVPSQNLRGTSMRQADHIWPSPSASTSMGLNSALARVLNLTDTDPALARVQTVTNVITIAVYMWAVGVTVRLLRGRHELSEETRLALGYGLFFALMPLMTFHTHRHTFVFLLPAWTAIIATLMEDGDRRRMTMFGALFASIYVVVGLPVVVTTFDRLLATRLASAAAFDDPIWGNLALTLSLSIYALLRTFDVAARTARNKPG